MTRYDLRAPIGGGQVHRVHRFDGQDVLNQCKITPNEHGYDVEVPDSAEYVALVLGPHGWREYRLNRGYAEVIGS